MRIERSKELRFEIDKSDINSRIVDPRGIIIHDSYKNVYVSAPCSIPESERNRCVEEGIIKYGSSLEFVEITHSDDDENKINIQYGLRICTERFIGERNTRTS